MKKNIKNIKNIIAVLIGISFIAFAIIFTLNSPQQIKAEATSGLPATLATSSPRQVGTSTTPTILAQGNNVCTSRVISTTNQPIMLSFGFAYDQNGVYGSTTLSQNQGIFQAASSTIAYDSGLYGCGTTSAISVVSNANIATSTVTTNSYR